VEVPLPPFWVFILFINIKQQLKIGLLFAKRNMNL
tara:strand:- start:85559 stop:85663 length:105 start_codon:yes stop_codon:yes gene_type:complete